MGLIPVLELKPEMVLADDVSARNGRFLLSKGTKLTTKHISMLETWGVVDVQVEGVSADELEAGGPPGINPLVLEAAEAKVRCRFQHNDLSHPAVRVLFRLCIEREAVRPVENESGSGSGLECPVLPDPARRPAEDPALSRPVTIDMKELLRNNHTLSTLPLMLSQLNEALNNPSSSAKDIANIISMDASLSARLLMMVNSSFYGYPSKIDTLHRAVLVLGTRQLGALAIGIKVINFFEKIPSRLINMRSFLEHSIACGILAKTLAGYSSTQSSERLFVGGLLHDLGRLILYNHAPDEARGAIETSRRTGELLYEVEQKTMSCDHPTLGGSVLRDWKLPLSLENMVRFHHRPLESKDPLEPAIVHLADMVANALRMGSSGECNVPPLSDDVWRLLDLSPNALAPVINQAEYQFNAVFQLLTSAKD